MENTKIISKEYYRNHVLCFREQQSLSDNIVMTTNEVLPAIRQSTDDTGSAPEKMCIGEVFRENERIAYCEASDKESARQYCRQIVDSQIAQSNSIQTGLPPDQTRLLRALRTIEEQLDARLHRILHTHWAHKNQALSIDILKQAGALDSTTAVYLAYAEFARLLCDAMSYIPVMPRSGQDPYLSMIIEALEPDIHSSDSLSLRLTPPIQCALDAFFSA